MSDHLPNAVEIFSEALALPVAERAAFLERACGGNQTLRAQVEELLRAHDEAGDFLKQAAAESPGLGNLGKVGEKLGDRVGRYKLLQQIGEGGWGVVYMAEQEQPVRRMVALKVVKPGMDTKNVIARFEAERQALALMEHPNIAKVLDAGATETGRPYFVMELVRGIKITEYCDQHSLSTTDRLELFIQVCHAVQHAHQKGIIHRDLKPSNILVTAGEDGAPLPKVIDFGIAKATSGQRLTDKTVFTAFEMLIGTPAYMSPEQAAMTNVDVDTRTDIYSLGVLLYELLTGTTPFDTTELLKAGLDEVRRAITLQEPVRPSTRLSSMLDADLIAIAERRRIEAPKLIRAVRGDLDWIVIKALEKDRTRRYETANGLALDVKRSLANETISARPPSTFYKIQKTVLRNKLLFGAVGIVVTLLVGSLVVVSNSLRRERQVRLRAQTEEARSREVTRFLENMLQGVGPSIALGRDTTMLREMLDRTVDSMGRELTNQPAVESQLRSFLGRLFQDIGDYRQAEQMHRAAVRLNRELFGSQSRETAMALNDLGDPLRSLNLAESETVCREALEIRKRLFGAEHLEVAASLASLASVYMQQGRNPEAEAVCREALRLRQKFLGSNNLRTADSLRTLAIIVGVNGRWEEAEKMLREVLVTRQQLLGAEHPLVATSLTDVAWAIGGRKNTEEAVALEREALAMRLKLLPPEHPDNPKSLYLVADRMLQRGDVSEAHGILRAALSLQRKILGPDDQATLDTMRSLGTVLEAEGKLTEAEQVHQEAVNLWRKRPEYESPQALAQLENLTRVLLAQKKFGGAEQLVDEALTPAVLQLPASGNLLALKADLRARAGNWAEAAATLALFYERQPQNHGQYCTLAALLVKANDQTGYEQFCQRLLASATNVSYLFIADAVAKACVFRPVPSLDLEAVSRLSDLTLIQGANDAGALPYFQMCRAMVEYRKGNFSAASEWAQKTITAPSPNAHGYAYGVQAMACARLGKLAEAREILAKGEALAPRVMPPELAETPDNSWLAWLFARIVLDEAVSVVQSFAPGEKSVAKP